MGASDVRHDGGAARGDSRRPSLPRAQRGDVQGLRALAVLLVIAAHAGLGPFTGGYLGVDVFLVISGFLISRLLFRQVSRTGTLSLRVFYVRRARRILPAATVVIVATVLASLVWLSLVDLQTLLVDAVWAGLFAANLRFAATDTDYFSEGLAPSPLQHYWSLGVEEQFYLVWPLLVLGALLLHQRRHGPRARRSLPRLTVFWMLAAVTGLSLGWSVLVTLVEPEAAYFSTTARIWELGVGAMAALVGPAIADRLTTRARTALGVVGLLGILVPAVAYTTGTSFPGLAALPPVLGTALLLIAGLRLREAPPWPSRTLGIAPLRVVGDWSYSLYLWHWPLLVIPSANLGRDLTLGESLAAVAATFVLAALTYRYVEQPFRAPLAERSREGAPRRLRARLPRGLVLYPTSVAVVVASSLGGWAYLQWASEASDAPAITTTRYGIEPSEAPGEVEPSADAEARALVKASVAAAREGAPVPGDLTPDLLDVRDDIAGVGACDYNDDSLRELCPRGDVGGERTMVVTGDSHARAWIPALDAIAAERGYEAYFLVKPRCPAARVTTTVAGSADPWPACTEFQDWVDEQVAELEPDLTIVSTTAPPKGLWVDDEYVEDTAGVVAEFSDGITERLEDLQPLSATTLVLGDVPQVSLDPAECLSSGDPDLGTCLGTPIERTSLVAEVTREAAWATGTPYLNPESWLCYDGECPAVVGSTVTYRDSGHITTAYSEQLTGALDEALDDKVDLS
ncbi:SGNH hydrolase domain-containing protein [Nocardioides lentus]|uniref:SGNH hydrolase domain-containing protein n=1 Tax=Nocardioides lentus TaxID=338077 RepID=A0ABN2PRF3_9ACTN